MKSRSKGWARYLIAGRSDEVVLRGERQAASQREGNTFTLRQRWLI